MATTYPVRIITTSIARDWREVCAFVGTPENLPQWAAGLASGVRKDGADLIAESPVGPVRVRFVPANDFGVLDHTVTLPDGGEVYVPLRVVANGGGAEVMFTLYQLAHMSEANLARDADMVERDLSTLKGLMER
jgi:hypothetical protein